jgi:hypothetical protein
MVTSLSLDGIRVIGRWYQGRCIDGIGARRSSVDGVRVVGRGYQGGMSMVFGRYVDRIGETYRWPRDASRCDIMGDLNGRRVDDSREVDRLYQGGR